MPIDLSDPFVMLVLGYLALQGISLALLRGGPRRCAGWVALAGAAMYAFVVIGGLSGSNIVPIWLLFFNPVAILVLTLLLLAGLVGALRR